MSSIAEIKQRQRRWAESMGLLPDARGYLASVEENLLRPLAPETRRGFESGSGSELRDTPSRPAKMRALHSSSALAVNVFDSWVDKDTSALMPALGLETEITSIRFEEQYSTGLTGNPPNLDVVLVLSSGHVIGIESKFSEWLKPKARSRPPFKPKYFPEGIGLWRKRNLPRSQELAAAIDAGNEHFRYLDAPQLLKHALGLGTQLEGRFSLYYIYYDWPAEESRHHKHEVDHFVDLVGSELRFKATSYQTLFHSLDGLDSVDKDYLGYLWGRYFSDAT